MNIYLPDVAYARKELYRLTEVETTLRKNIVDLRTNYKGSSSAETQARIFTDRLREDVRPAINECLKYLAKHA